MKKFFSNFITFILIILIIAILGLIGYFILDVTGTVDIPKEYSILSFFNNQIEVIANGKDTSVEDSNLNSKISNVIDTKIINKKEETKDNNIKTNENTDDDSIPLSEVLEELEEENNNSQGNTSNGENINYDVETLNEDVNIARLYYNQLDQYGKKIYDKLYENKDNMKSGTYDIDYDDYFNDLLHEENGQETLNNAFQGAINALTYDNPDIFYIDITKMSLLTHTYSNWFNSKYYVEIGGNGNNYLVSEFIGDNNLQVATSISESVRNRLVENSKDKSTYDKIKYVHDYLIENVEYNLGGGDSVYNVYGALNNHECVCEGYARAFKYILDYMNIPCIIVCGLGENSTGTTENHAWNYVYLDDNWYAVDCTWDDPIVRGNGKLSDEQKHKYFLVGYQTISKDHFENGNIVENIFFKYPEISQVNYEN